MNELEKAYQEIESWHCYSEQEGFVDEEELSYLDYVKKHIDNLQSKIDKAIEYIENTIVMSDGTKEKDTITGENLLNILKEDK